MESNYQIRRAELEDKGNIIRFVNLEWKKAQTLNDDKLFAYYFADSDKLNFVIAVKNNEIVATCGFIKAAGQDIWGSSWLIKKGEKPTLFFQLMKFFEEEGFTIWGLNPEAYTKELYRILGFEISKLNHFYKLFDKEEYKIATIREKQIRSNWSDRYKVIELHSEAILKEKINDAIFEKQKPKKSCDYMIKRYYRFPYPQYQYRVWAIETSKGNISTLFVTREQTVEGEKILRIVDIIGSENELTGIGKFFEEQGEMNDYEYIDCWCLGISDEVLESLGFVKCDNSVNIIPDRLEPLEKQNEEICFVYKNMPGVRGFRADGDMDRPNIWFKN